MFEPFKKVNDYCYFIDWKLDSQYQIVSGFTTKHGGVSQSFNGSLNLAFHVHDKLEHVQDNRKILAAQLDFPINTWVGAEQTHEDVIQKIVEQDKGKGALEYETSFAHTDGLYSDDQNILLTLAFADCVPLYFIAPRYNRVGIAHAGWKGTAKGIGYKMIDKWVKDGISTDEIYAVIGPSICKNCYTVDDRVIDAMKPWMQENLPYIEKTTGQYDLDLRELNKIILMKSGLRREHIQVTTLCTSCQEQEFFSHRRDLGKTGRMLGFIGMKGENTK
ncbi:peptidoglycan editing factor PgeF [Heyndrickxia ginsengihumi]|uniref:peptidoglycan editing factor PgeF n=1 Tax=Heyndrickxia ginsengihumi TaxID=363870 RepID=UPI000472FA20|nr:peptidoglycan editing factor PgeF [Heyndrickxia ginsengihumi]MBE6183432.1 peptidoglycan editing factor PgeF [Bacillus sp. (in: firmicutes)]MCM3022415.1 peptidoglycan editing factor PgeF [Heyndrickxia ginsengihumi]